MFLKLQKFLKDHNGKKDQFKKLNSLTSFDLLLINIFLND